MMNSQIADQFLEKLRNLYQNDRYSEIIDLIDEERNRFPNQQIYLSYWKMGMAARLEKKALAFRVMDDLLAQGLWISQELLRHSPSLESLQGEEDFEERVARFNSLQSKEQAQLLPLLVLRQEKRCDAGEEPCPGLMGLHANQAIALDAIKYWKPLASEGWLVALPQSTQAYWSGAFVWDDLERTQQELDNHLVALSTNYAVHPGRIVLAGNSSAGEIAVWLLLAGGSDANSFIAVNPQGPFMDNPEEWKKLMTARRPPETLRGAVLVWGDDQSDQLRRSQELLDLFGEFALPCYFDRLPGPVDDFPDEYAAALFQAKDFILQ